MVARINAQRFRDELFFFAQGIGTPGEHRVSVIDAAGWRLTNSME
jgi:hypothetical protein